jgi:hypothetical protein
MYSSYNDAFFKAMTDGLTINTTFKNLTNTDFWEQYMLNSFQFSSAKSLAEMRLLQQMVFDENKVKKSFSKFVKDVEAAGIQEKFRTWTRVEYDLASRGAVMAEKWKQIWQDRDINPYMVYQTRHDARVRFEHSLNDGLVMRIDSLKAQMLYPPLDWNCYDNETFVYTKRGFQLFENLRKDDLFFTLNPDTRIPEWQNAINFIKYKYSGKMINIKAHNFNLCVTPSHLLLIHTSWDRHEHRDILKFKEAKTIADSDGIFKSSKWNGKNENRIYIAGQYWNTIDYAAFMGWYLSEGSTSKRKYGFQICICQQKIDYLDLIYDDLKNIPFNKSLKKDRLCFYNNDLGEYLYQFGKSNSKYIPDEILNLSNDYLSIFLDRFVKGDGHIQKGGKTISGKKYKDFMTVFSTSQLMIDQIIEISLKLGKSCTKSRRPVKGKMVVHKNGTYMTNNDMFRVNISESQNFIFHKKYLSEIDYDDYVYCVEVPKYNTLLVNKNGKVHWNGNCRCTVQTTYEGNPASEDELQKHLNEVPEEFRNNVGIDGIFPSKKYSYGQVFKNANVGNPEMFETKTYNNVPVTQSDIEKIKKGKYGEFIKYDEKSNPGEKLIQSYTKRLFDPLNKNLNKSIIDDETLFIESKLNSALDALPKHQGSVFRGIDLGGEDQVSIHNNALNFISKLQKEKIFTFNGFTSASEDIDRALIFKGNYSEIIFNINSKNGRNVQSLSRMKDLNGRDIEKEILFKSKSKFEFKNIETIDRNIKIDGEIKKIFSHYVITLNEI